MTQGSIVIALQLFAHDLSGLRTFRIMRWRR